MDFLLSVHANTIDDVEGSESKAFSEVARTINAKIMFSHNLQ